MRSLITFCLSSSRCDSAWKRALTKSIYLWPTRRRHDSGFRTAVIYGSENPIPTRYAHQKVTAIAGIEEVRLVVQDQLVAKHPRDWTKEQVHHDPVHYLALLERKPGALDFAKPLENWGLPDCFDLLRRRLEADAGSHGRREYIKTLRLLETISLSDLTKAIERALEIDVLAVDAIRLLVQQGLESTKWFRLDNHPHLQLHSITHHKLCRYQCLRRRED